MKRANLSAIAATLLLSLLTLACQSSASRDHKRVRRAAERSYNLLAKGRYADYVDAIAHADSATTEQRQALADVASEYAARLQREHGSLTSVAAVSDTIYGDSAHVFLLLTFGDGLTEQVGLPMLRVGGTWRME